MARYAVKRKMVHIGKRQRGKKAMGENAFGGIGARANGEYIILVYPVCGNYWGRPSGENCMLKQKGDA